MKLFYLSYLFYLIVFGLLFLLSGVSIARGLNDMFPKFDRFNPKPKSIYLLEICAQVSLIIILSYSFREISQFFVSYFLSKNIQLYGSPNKYASLIIAPTMFTVQPNLFKKIKYVWNLEFYEWSLRYDN